MKTILQVVLGVMFIISCTEKEKDNETELRRKNQIDITKQQQKVRKQENEDRLIQLQNLNDSLRLIDFRKNAFDLANKPVEERVNEIISNNGKVVFFKNSKDFLYLRFNVNSWMQKIEFYKLEYGNPELLWEERWENMTFVGDTIRDVNGDNQFDVLIKFYPSSGCCRRNSFWVRLFDDRTKEFTERMRMINPTFYPDEKIVRGVNYGHPGEVPVYKMKWNKNKLDTIEYIYPFPDEKGKFLVTKKHEIYPQRYTPPRGEIIYSLPKEYKDIESIEWFLDY